MQKARMQGRAGEGTPCERGVFQRRGPTRSMPNAKGQMSNECQSSNDKAPDPKVGREVRAGVEPVSLGIRILTLNQGIPSPPVRGGGNRWVAFLPGRQGS